MATKTLPDRTHLDHGLTKQQLQYVLAYCGGKVYDEARLNDNIVTFELPEHLGTVPCALYGPTMGDSPVGEESVSYRQRGDRAWNSRIIQEPWRRTSKLTAIIAPESAIKGDKPLNPDSKLVEDWILITAYGGPPAPREPGDTSLPPEGAAMAQSIEFWRHHALAIQ